jgi:hypothetical protein
LAQSFEDDRITGLLDFIHRPAQQGPFCRRRLRWSYLKCLSLPTGTKHSSNLIIPRFLRKEFWFVVIAPKHTKFAAIFNEHHKNKSTYSSVTPKVLSIQLHSSCATGVVEQQHIWSLRLLLQKLPSDHLPGKKTQQFSKRPLVNQIHNQTA